MATYRHEPIDLAGHTFRLLRLLKGEFSEIQCELVSAWLGQDISYEALSYTWGSTKKTSTITIDGRLLSVTENLYQALWNLRLKNEDRIIWVDAVCIDQTNLKERSHQVQQMGTIYKEAEQVIIWLGPATAETDIIMDSIRYLYEQMDRDCFNSTERWKEFWPGTGSTLGSLYPNLKAKQRAGLSSLIGRPWFRRVWILQEVANARAATVVCGSKTVPARIFASTPVLLDVVPDSHCQCVLSIFPGHSREESWWSQRRDLGTMLVKFGRSRATDPRDIVYALLGISSDTCDNDVLYADYSKSLNQVIQDTAAFVFRKPVALGNTGSRLVAEGQPELPELPFGSEVGYYSADWHSWKPLLVQLVLQDPTRLDLRDEGGRTPLSWAASGKTEATVRLLLEGQDKMNSAYGRWQAPLPSVTVETVKDIVSMLLETKAQADSRDSQNRTPLWYAAQHGRIEVVSILLRTANVEVDTKDRVGQTPLSQAARNGHYGVVKLLLETHMVDIYSTDIYGMTPVSQAARYKHQSTVELLLQWTKTQLIFGEPSDQSQLSQTVQDGLKAQANALFEAGETEVHFKDFHYQPRPSQTAQVGYVALAGVLEADDAQMASKDADEQTLPSQTAQDEYETLARGFWKAEEAQMESEDADEQTLLSQLSARLWKRIVLAHKSWRSRNII